jgi:ParB family transcriptional regulator, chromosome partitioning protein
MISSARRFNLDKVNREDLGRMSGPLLAEDTE